MKALKVKCQDCKLVVRVNQANSSKVTLREHNQENRRFALAADCTGLDKSDLEFICEILDIGSPPDSFYTLHQEDIKKAVVDKAEMANR